MGKKKNRNISGQVPKAIIHKSNKRGVGSVISRCDYNKILKYAKENISESGYAVRLQDFLGVRVEEVARISKNNINLAARTIKLTNTKGGRELIREIPADKVGLVKEILEKNYHSERLLSIKGDSINRYLNRVEDKLNIERHSNHDIRRLIAQEKYDSYRSEGMSIKEADSETSKWLNHNDDRTSLLEKSYIILR